VGRARTGEACRYSLWTMAIKKDTAPPRGAKLMKKSVEAAKATGVLGRAEHARPPP
jgi:hypothetical protein